MVNLVTALSKYLMILLMAIYTYYNFRYLAMQEEDSRKTVLRLQTAALFLLHILAFLILYLHTQEERILMFYGAQVLFFELYPAFYKLFYHNCSRLLLNNACLLLCVSLIVLTRISFERALRQFVFVLLGAALTLIIPFIVERVWQLADIPWFYGCLGLSLLLVVCLFGDKSYGAQLSLKIGTLSFQPSEFVKISYVFFAAAMFYRSVSFRHVAAATAAAAAHVLILTLSKDLGSGLLFFATYLLMLFVATSNWFYLGAGAGSGAAAAAAAYRLFSHVRARVAAWQNPWADISGKGYQVAQSLFAIGTGGWFGMGLCQGMPKGIPVVEKDFIFAAISEELGGVFALCILLLCLGCFLQFMMLAARMQALFYKLLAFGLGIIYVIQVFLTIGGVVKFIPSTGITLPFVSYGGSSLFATFILFGVIQGLYVLKGNEEEAGYEEG